MSNKIRIQDFEISSTSPVFFIAEAGVNHNGSLEMAFELIDVAVSSRADAVKFQLFKTENLILEDVEKAAYQKVTTDSDESQYEMLKKLEMNIGQMRKLQGYCQDKKIIFLTTAFDIDSLDDLDPLNLPAYKVASTDLTNISFLRSVANKGKPIILSTGMSSMEEVKTAIRAIRTSNDQLIILQCTSSYPVDANQVNLNVLKTMKKELDYPIGFSDHTEGIGAAPYAVAIGAKVIEKHFTLDKSLEGPDHRASLNPQELKACIHEIRKVESYMGASEKLPTKSERDTKKLMQKYLVASKNIETGDSFSLENVKAMRTGAKGISAIHIDELMGKTAPRSFTKNEIIELDE